MYLLSRSHLTALASCLFFMSSFAEAGSLRNMVKVVSTMIDAPTASSQHDHGLAKIKHDKLASIEGMNAERDLIFLPDSYFTEDEFLHAYMDSNSKSVLQTNEFPSMHAGITVHYTSEYAMKLEYSIFDGPTNCKNCLVAIHEGKDCAKPKRGRYWNKKSDTVHKNPWTKRNGAVLKTDSDGNGSGTLDAMILSNGYTFDENLDHVVAIYDGHRLSAKNPMKRATMIACGVLRKVVA